MSLLRRFLNLFRRRKLDVEMAEEMRAHLEMQAERNRVTGMSPDEARYAALREFGNMVSIQQQAREARGWIWLEQLFQDVRYAIRQLTRTRGTAFAIVLVLGLGIGSCTAVFSLVDALLFRPVSIRDPGRLHAVSFVTATGQPGFASITSPCVREFRGSVSALEDIVGQAPVSGALRSGDFALAPAAGFMVTGNYFQALGVQPILGRGFLPEEDLSDGRNPVAVISYECWQSVFGGSPDVVGRTFHLNNQLLTVVGVAPAGFRGLEGIRPTMFWAPSALDRALNVHAVYQLNGYIRTEVAVQQATEECNRVMVELAQKYGTRAVPGYEQYGPIPRNLKTTLVPAGSGVLPRGGTAHQNSAKIVALFGVAVGLVLLVACSNAASLLMVRALARRREIAVRLALGATRSRLLRQLLAESLLLSGLAGLAGLLIARFGIAAVLSMRVGMLSYLTVDAQLDVRVLVFTAFIALGTGTVFGLLPAGQALNFDVHATLKQETSVASALYSRLAIRRWLLFIQVVISTVLLAGAGLSLRSVIQLMRVDPGFDVENVLTVAFSVDRDKYSAMAEQEIVQRLSERVAAAPGVEMVALSGPMSPLSGSRSSMGVDQIEGYAKKPGENLQVAWMAVGPGYFRLLRTSLVAGREFNRSDVQGRPRVVLVNEAFVRRYWPDQNSLGKSLHGATVVGVVSDTRNEQLSLEAQPTMYTNILQDGMGAFTMLIRTESNPASLAPLVRSELTRLDPEAWPPKIETLRDAWYASMILQRMLLWLLAVFAVIALGLAAVGLYGFVACSVSQRAREFGIRIAVGATARDILKLVLRHGMDLVLLGLTVGVLLALAAGRLVQGFLYGVSAIDPLALVCVCAILIIVSVIACWLPAQRATKIDPVVALRAE